MVNKMTYIHDNRTGEIRTVTEFEDHIWDEMIDGVWEDDFSNYLADYWTMAEVFSFDIDKKKQVEDNFCKFVIEEIMTGNSENFSVVDIS